MAPTAPTSQFGRVESKQEAVDRKDRTAPAAKKLPKAEGRQLAREYSLAKDSGEDSWQIFLDLARDYKHATLVWQPFTSTQTSRVSSTV